MNVSRWNEIERLYFEALARPPAARDAFVTAASAGDTELQAEILAMLTASEDSQALRIEGRLAGGDVAAAAMAAERIGQRVGVYRLTGLLGRGGMGEVYLAERVDEQFRQTVAVKLLRTEARTPELLARFRAERQILAQLVHPHIARLLDGGMTDDGHPYLVMQAIDGEPITDYCDARQLAIRERLRLFRTVCTTVQFAHQSLVVHRDLKPSNILVTDQGEVKLLDFGIAKLLEPQVIGLSAALTRTELRLMTPEYAAPEQLRGQAVTTAADVYGLGLLLYELLTGHHPFELSGKSPSEVERIVCEEDPPRPSQVVARQVERRRPAGGRETVTPATIAHARRTHPGELRRHLRGDLGTMALMALRKDPVRRYATAGQLAEDVERYLRSEPVIAQRDSLAYRARKFVQRNRVGVVAGATIAVLLLAFSIITTLQARQLSRERDAARSERDHSDQVVQVLVDLFESNNPDLDPGRDTLRVREFLQQSEARVIEELAEQPLVQARMQHVLGKVYRARSQYTRARDLFREAYDNQQRLAGEEDPTTAAVFHDLATVEGMLQGSSAIPMLQQSLARLRRVHGDRDAQVAQAMQDLAEVVDDPVERLGLITDALEIRRRLAPDGDVAVASSLNQLAGFYHARQDYALAAELYRETLDLTRQHLGPNHPHALTVEQNLATTHSAIGDYEQAEAMLRDVLERRRQLVGEGTVHEATTLNNLGALLVAQRDYAGATEFFEQSVAIYRDIYGSAHAATANAVRNLGMLALYEGDSRQALAYLDDALSAQREFAGDSNPSSLHMAVQRAVVWIDLGRATAARDTLSALLSALAQVTQDAGAYQLADARVALGRALLHTGEAPDAERHFRLALASRTERFGGRHGATAEAEAGLGLALAAQNRQVEAIPRLEVAVPRYSDWSRAVPGFVAELREGLSQAHATGGRSDAASLVRDPATAPAVNGIR
jgi:serine/threonine-protein kinase